MFVFKYKLTTCITFVNIVKHEDNIGLYGSMCLDLFYTTWTGSGWIQELVYQRGSEDPYLRN